MYNQLISFDDSFYAVRRKRWLDHILIALTNTKANNTGIDESWVDN